MDLRSHIRLLIREAIRPSFHPIEDVTPITSKQAAQIASMWHGGQNSAFYSLASTGRYFPQLHSEYMRELRSAPVDVNNPDDMLHLEQLENWLKQQAAKYAPDQLDSDLHEPHAHITDKALKAYLEAAIFLGGEDGLEKEYSVDDFTLEAINSAKKDLADFRQRAGHLLDGISDESLGYDFWLTRNHSGAGFWDRGYEEEVGKGLTDIAHSFGERHCEVQDDGQLTIY